MERKAVVVAVVVVVGMLVLSLPGLAEICVTCGGDHPPGTAHKKPCTCQVQITEETASVQRAGDTQELAFQIQVKAFLETPHVPNRFQENHLVGLRWSFGLEGIRNTSFTFSERLVAFAEGDNFFGPICPGVLLTLPPRLITQALLADQIRFLVSLRLKRKPEEVLDVQPNSPERSAMRVYTTLFLDCGAGQRRSEANLLLFGIPSSARFPGR